MRIFLFIVLLLFSSRLFAGISVKGTIKDYNSGEELIGVTLIVKEDPAKGAISGLNGSFVINDLTNSDTLICSYLGYETVEYPINTNENSKLIILLKPVSFQINDVVVSMNAKNNEVGARLIEKNAVNVLNVVSAKAIEISPDLTVANVLQRVSGISVEKNGQGEGRYPIIRGMDKRYSYTLVDGIKIPSPDDKNRYVPMDIFPADLLDRLEVSKSLTANMEGDAIGGSMNMVMKDAPEKFILKANLATGYSQYLIDNPYYKFDTKPINDKSPAELHSGVDYWATENDFPMKNLAQVKTTALPDLVAGLTIGGRLGNKKQWGLLLGSSYQNFYRGTNSTFFLLHSQPDIENNPVFDDMQIRKYSTRETRVGINAKADYRFNNNNKIDFSYLYVNLTQLQARNIVDTALFVHRTGSGNGLVTVDYRSRLQWQTIHNFALSGNHQIFDKMKADWSLSCSIAQSRTPDQADFSTSQSVSNNVLTPQLLRDMHRKWFHTNDKNIDVKANVYYNPFKNSPVEFSAGGLYRRKDRDNYLNEYTLTAQMIGNDFQQFTDIEQASYHFGNSSNGRGSIVNPNTYQAKEDITAFYGQIKFSKPKYEIILGLRNEITNNSYSTAMPDDFEGRIGSNHYSDLLPSVHVKYKLTPKQNLHLSYYRSICRPGFFEVVPYRIEGEYFNEWGNPYIKHTVADNLDLRYELFPNSVDQILAGIFYKKLTNPIENVVEKVDINALAMIPENSDNAVNYGFEVVMTKYFLHFGVSFNYTLTQSSITTNKLYYQSDYTNIIVQEKRPLQGQSKHIGNMSLLYKNQKKGVNVQVSGIFTGRRISSLSAYEGLDYWQNDYMQMDLSAEKTIFKNIVIYAKINNLLSTPLTESVNKPNTWGNFVPMQTDKDKLLVRKEIYKPTYQLGLRIIF